MNAPARTFDAKPAVREQVPLLIGIMSPSGGGKTYSALRLATGMQEVFGGDIYVLDTENRRALHYADRFKFVHVPFEPPFGSADYLAAIRFCASKKPGVIIVDSMSHEHIGQGGYLETAEAVIDRIAGNDYAKREKAKFAGWAKAGPARTTMIEGIKQLNANFIFCWRAKEKTKPMNIDGKLKAVEMGLMPLAGEEWVYEMMVNCMLPARAEGVPQWRADHVGERLMMKLPEQFKTVFAEQKPLDESTGRALATWARGDSSPQANPPGVAAADHGAPAHSPPGSPAGAPTVPTAAAYTAQWNGIVDAATRSAQLGKAWNEQNDLRGQIEWTDEHPFSVIKSRVTRAIEFLKENGA